jgi:hypothetical protein
VSRKNTEQDFGPEPTFEEFEAARKVIIFVRRMLAAERLGRGACRAGRDPLALADSPVMAEIVMRSSSVCNPARWEQTQLASAEGQYERSYYDAARAGE